MDAERYYAAQLTLFDRLVAGRTASTVVPLRPEYVGVATCLTLIHLLPNALSPLIDGRVLDRLGAFRSKHCWSRRSRRCAISSLQSARSARRASFNAMKCVVAAPVSCCGNSHFEPECSCEAHLRDQ